MNVQNNNKLDIFGIISLVLGVLSLISYSFRLFIFIPIIFGIGSIVLGIIALVNKENKALAIVGIVLSAISIFITISYKIYTIVTINKINEDVTEKIDDLNKKYEEDELTQDEILKKYLDVEIGELEVSTDEYGITDSTLPVTIKNISNEKHSFSILIEAVNKNGERIDEDYIFASGLSKNQSQTFEIFTFLDSDEIKEIQEAEIKIVEVRVD